MENIAAIKSERRLLKHLLSYTSNITWFQAAAWLMCFIFSRASIFDILKPFAAAFYVSVGFTGVSKVFAILSVTVGNAFFSNFYETVRQVLALLLFEALSHITFRIAGRKETPLSRSTLLAVLIGFTGLLRGLVQGIHLYDLVVSLLCAALVFSLCIIMAPASETFQSARKKCLFSGRMLLAKATLLCVAVISLEDVMVWNCEIGTILTGIVVLIIARRKGSAVGACTGALMGMVISLYDLPSSLEIPGMLALAGAAAGLPVKSRTASVTLWTMVIIFFSGLSILEGELIIKYYEALASGILFFIIPQSFLDVLSDELAGLRGGAEVIQLYDSSRTHEAADRLFVLSKALSRVSRSIEDTLLEEKDEENSAAEWMIETVAEKVCNRCSLCERCWGTHFLKTYKLVEKSISDLKTNESGQLEIPAWFLSTCTRSDKFIETLGSAYSLFKAENVWRLKLNESRMLLARQAALISSSVMTAARGIMDTSGRDYEIEGMLLSVAGNRGIPVSSFRYHDRQDSRPDLEAIFEAKNKLNAKALDEIVQETLNSGLIRVGESRRDVMGYSVVHYMKRPKFKTATGVARISRETNVVSGDNFAFFISGEGYHISAISDGAGSGRRADRYSRTAVQMLENLMEDGIELGLAIRLMNLYLNLRGENERLATMDICAIDLASGETSFYKYGASFSFIKGQQGVVVVNTEEKDPEGLPIAHYRPAAMTAGDLAIMVSDGVLEAFSEDGEVLGLQRYIEQMDTSNAQQLADDLLKEALVRAKNHRDDMTILVTRLW